MLADGEGARQRAAAREWHADGAQPGIQPAVRWSAGRQFLLAAGCCWLLRLAAACCGLLRLAACCCWLLLATGCWLLAAGCWLLAAGSWQLACGCRCRCCWLLAVKQLLAFKQLWLSNTVAANLQCRRCAPTCECDPTADAMPAPAAWLAVGEIAILLYPPLPLVGVSIETMIECQQNDSLADG